MAMDHAENSTKVQCRICGEWLALIHHLHLKSHGVTREEYLEHFQIEDAYELVAPAFRVAVSGRSDYVPYTKAGLEAEFWLIYETHKECSDKLFSTQYSKIYNQLTLLHGAWRDVLIYFGFDPDAERLSSVSIPIELRVEKIKSAVMKKGKLPEEQRQNWATLRGRLGSSKAIFETVGMAREEVFPDRFRSDEEVLTELREFQKKRALGDVSPIPTKLYSILKSKFGSFAVALQKAGLTKHDFFLKKLWTKEEMLQEIRELAECYQDLRLGNISKLRQDLAAAANKYYGGWYDALDAAGIDSMKHRPERLKKVAYIRETWSKARLSEEMAKLKESGKSIQIEDVKVDCPELVIAATFYHGAWAMACRTHGLLKPKNPWTEEKVLRGLQERRLRGESLKGNAVNLSHNSLYMAGRKLFGAWGNVLAALDRFDSQQSPDHSMKVVEQNVSSICRS